MSLTKKYIYIHQSSQGENAAPDFIRNALGRAWVPTTTTGMQYGWEPTPGTSERPFENIAYGPVIKWGTQLFNGVVLPARTQICSVTPNGWMFNDPVTGQSQSTSAEYCTLEDTSGATGLLWDHPAAPWEITTYWSYMFDDHHSYGNPIEILQRIVNARSWWQNGGAPSDPEVLSSFPGSPIPGDDPFFTTNSPCGHRLLMFPDATSQGPGMIMQGNDLMAWEYFPNALPTRLFKDSWFQMSAPFSKGESANYSEDPEQTSRAVSSNVTFNYNFYMKAYEQVLAGDTPFGSEGTDTGIGEITIPHLYLTVNSPGPLPYALYLQNNAYDRFTAFADLVLKTGYRDLLIPVKQQPFLQASNIYRRQFPMDATVSFGTDRNTFVADSLEDSKMDSVMLRRLSEGPVGTTLAVNRNMTYSYLRKYYDTISGDAANYGTVFERSIQTFDFYDWVKSLPNVPPSSVPLPGDHVFLGLANDSADMALKSGLYNVDFSFLANHIILSGKINEIAHKHLRTYEQMMIGYTPHSETLAYRISKYRTQDIIDTTQDVIGLVALVDSGLLSSDLVASIAQGLTSDTSAAQELTTALNNPDNIEQLFSLFDTLGIEPIQNVWIPNSNSIDIIEYVDTQVKYNQGYTYMVKAYQLSVGTEYFYSSYNVYDPVVLETPDESSAAPIVVDHTQNYFAGNSTAVTNFTADMNAASWDQIVGNVGYEVIEGGGFFGQSYTSESPILNILINGSNAANFSTGQYYSFLQGNNASSGITSPPMAISLMSPSTSSPGGQPQIYIHYVIPDNNQPPSIETYGTSITGTGPRTWIGFWTSPAASLGSYTPTACDQFHATVLQLQQNILYNTGLAEGLNFGAGSTYGSNDVLPDPSNLISPATGDYGTGIEWASTPIYEEYETPTGGTQTIIAGFDWAPQSGGTPFNTFYGVEDAEDWLLGGSTQSPNSFDFSPGGGVYTEYSSTSAGLSSEQVYLGSQLNITVGSDSPGYGPDPDSGIGMSAISTSELNCPDLDICTKTFLVTTIPSLKVHEVPYFMWSGKVVDSFPVGPDVDIVPYRTVENELLFMLGAGMGGYRDYPIPIFPSEQQTFADLLDSQKSTDGKAEFRSDDPVQLFEILRLETPPRSYADFVVARRTTKNTINPDFPHKKSDATSFIERLESNQKYYYVFRSVDIHGHISNPSPIYEIEMVDSGGATYPLINIFEPELELSVDSGKKAQRLIQIRPEYLQSIINMAASTNGSGDTAASLNSPQLQTCEQAGDNIVLGTRDKTLWGKKFKLRLTSNETMRMLDININFKTKLIEDITEQTGIANPELGAPSFGTESSSNYGSGYTDSATPGPWDPMQQYSMYVASSAAATGLNLTVSPTFAGIAAQEFINLGFTPGQVNPDTGELYTFDETAGTWTSTGAPPPAGGYAGPGSTIIPFSDLTLSDWAAIQAAQDMDYDVISGPYGDFWQGTWDAGDVNELDYVMGMAPPPPPPPEPPPEQQAPYHPPPPPPAPPPTSTPEDIPDVGSPEYAAWKQQQLAQTPPPASGGSSAGSGAGTPPSGGGSSGGGGASTPPLPPGPKGGGGGGGY